jgi:hypothetical protein
MRIIYPIVAKLLNNLLSLQHLLQSDTSVKSYFKFGDFLGNEEVFSRWLIIYYGIFYKFDCLNFNSTVCENETPRE